MTANARSTPPRMWGSARTAFQAGRALRGPVGVYLLPVGSRDSRRGNLGATPSYPTRKVTAWAALLLQEIHRFTLFYTV